MRPTQLKQSLCADVEAFLASGGQIKTATKRPEAIPYLGTDKQANAVLCTAEGCAVRIGLRVETFLAHATESTFPQCYLHMGERKWKWKEVHAWRRRDMVFSEKFK
jgi:hypothetical protein